MTFFVYVSLAVNLMTENINQALGLIVKGAGPEKVILFGSQARGDARSDSDMDILVVVGELSNKGEVMKQIYRNLWDAKIYADVVVYTNKEFEYWKNTTNHICNEAFLDGKVLYDQTVA